MPQADKRGFDESLGCFRVSGSETRSEFREVVQEMESLVRSTLGPHGLDKLVVRRKQDDEIRGLVSNDGVSILEEFEGQVTHPIADRVIRVAEDQEKDVGDGTTTTVVFLSELLSAGLDLIDEGVGANYVIEGFSMAAQRALETWDEDAISLSTPNGAELDRELLRKVAVVGMTNGDTKTWPLESLADELIDAVLRVSEPRRGTVDLSKIRSEAVAGPTIGQSKLMNGAFLKAKPTRTSVSLPVTGPIMLVDSDVEPRTFDDEDTVADIDPSVTAEEFSELAQHRTDVVERLTRRIEATGTQSVISTEPIADEVADRLGNRGILTVDQVKDSHLRFIANATGARIFPSVQVSESISSENLGQARITRNERKGQEWLQIVNTGSETEDASTLLVYGGNETVAGEAERRVKDGLNTLRAAVMRPEALPGGGAAEISAALSIRKLAPRIGDRRQLALEAFADVLERVPQLLAKNAGLDPAGVTTELRNKHATNAPAGVSADREVADDMVSEGVLDPLLVKTNALVRGVEFANLYLHVDTVLAYQSEDPFEKAQRGETPFGPDDFEVNAGPEQPHGPL